MDILKEVYENPQDDKLANTLSENAYFRKRVCSAIKDEKMRELIFKNPHMFIEKNSSSYRLPIQVRFLKSRLKKILNPPKEYNNISDLEPERLSLFNQYLVHITPIVRYIDENGIITEEAVEWKDYMYKVIELVDKLKFRKNCIENMGGDDGSLSGCRSVEFPVNPISTIIKIETENETPICGIEINTRVIR